MSLTVTIAGVNRTQYVQHSSVSQLRITKTLGEPWTCSFTTCDTNGSYYPSVGQTVEITKGATVVFGGIVRSVLRRRVNDVIDLLWADVDCTDWNHILERRLAGEYQWFGKTGAEIITDIHANSLSGEGISITGISTGPTLESFQVQYGTVAEALGQLAQESEYTLFINASKTLKYFSPGTVTAPFDIEASPTNLTWMQTRETDEDYCNFVIGRVGNALREPQPETFDGDGAQTSFELAFPCAQQPQITLDGAPQTVGIAGVDTGRDWYWSEGSKEIRQDDAGAPITGTLEVNYVGIESIYVLAKDDAEIAARAAIEGTSGRYEKFIEIDRMLSRGDAQAVVDAYLEAHINLPLVTTYRTLDKHEPDAYLLEPGQTQSILVDGWGAQQTDYLVRSIQMTSKTFLGESDSDFEYEVEAIHGSLTQTAYQWFRDMAAQPSGSSRVDGDTEYFYWFLGGCDAVEAGDDVAAHWPTVHRPGRIGVVSLHCKTSPTSDLILDIKVTADGSTWDSIFESGSVTYPAGRTTPMFISNISAAGSSIYTGQWMRVDITQGGEAAGLSIKAAARPGVGRVGTTQFDNSQASGVTGTDETTEGLLVLL